MNQSEINENSRTIQLKVEGFFFPTSAEGCNCYLDSAGVILSIETVRLTNT